MLRLADIKGFELAYRRGKMTARQFESLAQFGMESRAREYYNEIVEGLRCNL